MVRVIYKNDNIKLIEDECMGYAVFKKVKYPSGSTAFWQQISKWYIYKKYAVDIYKKYC